MAKYFTSDWHLGHKRIITEDFSNRPWDTIEDHDNEIIENMVAGKTKNDILYFLGDFYWDQGAFWKFYSKAKHLRMIWVLGNHDQKVFRRHIPHFETITQMFETKILGNYATLCHYPMASWNKSHYNSFQLYGHHHLNGHHEPTVFGKQLNVNLEYHNYLPWTEEEIVEYMKGRPNNPDYIQK